VQRFTKVAALAAPSSALQEAANAKLETHAKMAVAAATLARNLIEHLLDRGIGGAEAATIERAASPINARPSMGFVRL
jgi:hypothetical protein